MTSQYISNGQDVREKDWKGDVEDEISILGGFAEVHQCPGRFKQEEGEHVEGSLIIHLTLFRLERLVLLGVHVVFEFMQADGVSSEEDGR